MADDKVTLEIEIDAKDAQAAIDLFGNGVIKSVKKAESSFVSLKASFSAVAVGVTAAIATVASAFNKLSDSIQESLDEAKELKQIRFALEATGEGSDAAVKSITDFTQAVRVATSVDDGFINQLFIQAKSFGITTEQAKKLTVAALDLAAATGQDAEAALRQLGATFDGTIGKIANLGVEFRDLSEEQAKNGAVIDLVTQKYGGASKASVDTYAGAINELSNAFRDILTETGNIITSNEAIIDSIKDTASAFTRSVSAIRSFGEAFSKFTDPLRERRESSAKKLVDDIESLGQSSSQAINIISSLETSLKQSSIQTATFSERLKELGAQSAPSIEGIGKAAKKSADELKKAQDEAQKFINGLILSSGSTIEVAAKKAGDTFTKITELQSKGLITFTQAEQARLSVTNEVNEKIIESNRKVFEEAEKEAERAEKARIKSQEELAKSVNFGINAVSSGLKGREGARELVSNSLGAIGDAILPGIGGAVGGLAQLLSQGPEATKKFIREFVEAIPDMITAIAESIPVVVEAFVYSMVNKGGAIKIGIAIAKAMAGVQIWAAIGKQLGIGFDENSTKGIEKAAGAFAEEGKSAASSFGAQFSESFKTFFANLAPAFTSFLQSIAPFFREAFNIGIDSFRNAMAEEFQRFPEVFNGLLDGFSDVLNSFIPNLINALASFFSNAFSPFVKIFQDIKPFFQGLIDGLSGLRLAFQPLVDALNALNEVISNFDLTGGGGGGGLGGAVGGFVEQVGEALGFARGGVVPKYAANGLFVPQGTDTVPAMLTPGELVVPRDMVGSLGAFLNKQETKTEEPGMTEALLTSILQVLSQPQNVETRVTLNQQAFADIILQLNRQNMRLSA